MPNETDDMRWSRLMSAAQLGDKKAYEQLLQEISSVIQAYLKSRFGTADFIEDVTQECLINIHKGRHSYDSKRPFRAWMFAIVKHRLVDYLRSNSDTPKMNMVDSSVGESALDNLKAKCAFESDLDASLILSKLSSEHKDVLMLTKYIGYNAQEAANHLGISPAAVRVRLHRAIKHTQRLLKAESML